MKLLTKTLINRFNSVGEQREIRDPLIIAKFFNPCGSATWYASSYDPQEQIFFGYVTGLVPGGYEWGYFSLTELGAIRCPPLGLPIERDRYFEEYRFSELRL